MRIGEINLLKCSRSYDQDGRHAHMWSKPLKFLVSRTKSPLIMYLFMQHLGLKLYKVYINVDLDLFYDKVKFERVTKMYI